MRRQGDPRTPAAAAALPSWVICRPPRTGPCPRGQSWVPPSAFQPSSPCLLGLSSGWSPRLVRAALPCTCFICLVSSLPARCTVSELPDELCALQALEVELGPELKKHGRQVVCLCHSHPPPGNTRSRKCIQDHVPAIGRGGRRDSPRSHGSPPRPLSLHGRSPPLPRPRLCALG